MASGMEIEEKARKRGKWLCRAGWTAFGLALVLPAVCVGIFGNDSWWPGWSCLWFTYQVAWDALTGSFGWTHDWGSAYYTALAVANTLMLASPVLNRLFRGSLRRLRWLGRAEALAACLTGGYVLFVDDLKSLGPGTYAWIASFSMLAAGTLQLSKRRPANLKNATQSPIMRTPEEIEAVRELEDYLHGIVRAPQTGEDEGHDHIRAGLTPRQARTHRRPARTRAAIA